VVYQTQRVYNGIALRVQARKIPQIARIGGVKAIHRLTLKELDNSYSVPLIGAPQVWNMGLGNTGSQIKVGIIDTGIDYLHTNFGGPGDGYDANDTTVVGDVPNYPDSKSLVGMTLSEMITMQAENPVPSSQPRSRSNGLQWSWFSRGWHSCWLWRT